MAGDDRVGRAGEETASERTRTAQLCALAEGSREALALLARSGVILTASLDYRQTLSDLTWLLVPALADGCIVRLREGNDVRTVAVAHVDPAREARLLTLDEDHPLSADAPHGYARVLRTGEPELIPAITDEILRATARDPAHLRVLRALGAASCMVVPMAAHGDPLGAITLFSSEGGRRYTDMDLLLAEDLGRRAAVAVQNARLFEMAREERRRVEEADRAKDEFLALVSHELRTPLTAILGWSRMLGRGMLDEEKRRRAAESIERNAIAQARIVDDLLDVSRIITGKLRIEVAPVVLQRVVQAALDAVRPAAEAKGVVLTPPPACPDARPILGDADRIQQVAWNLLANAVKFTPPGGSVRARLRRDEGFMELAIEDTGQGIPPDFLPHVFDRFRQAETGTTRSTTGLGLGLSIVRHLVELHGGAVEARSEGEDRGATFLVRLPIPAGPAPSPPGPPGSAPSRAAGAPRLTGLQVLAVDDDDDARELLALALEDAGALVTVASSAAEALRIIPELLPDVIVSDIAMPGEDGYGLIARVRALPAAEGGRIPAVALTALARAEDRTRALLAGFNMHVPKPVEPSELVAVVATLVRDTRR